MVLRHCPAKPHAIVIKRSLYLPSVDVLRALALKVFLGICQTRPCPRKKKQKKVKEATGEEKQLGRAARTAEGDV